MVFHPTAEFGMGLERLTEKLIGLNNIKEATLFPRDINRLSTIMKSIVEVKNLKKVYDKKTVVKGISFEVAKGEIFGILGPNGAGKTTTLEMIEALTPMDGGQIIVRREAMMFQNNLRK